MSQRPLVLLAASALALAVAVLAACDRTDSYLYSGQPVDEANACVDAYVPVDIIDGPGVTQECPPICFLYSDTLYVSIMCPPLPTLAEGVNENDPRCLAAKAAMKTPCAGGGEDPATADGGEDEDSGEPDVETDI